MPTNKNALLRYLVLDKCFQNIGRKYYFKDLMDAVNSALTEEDPFSSGIKTRQLREDIKFMRSESGYHAPIEAIRDGSSSYYRYSDPKYSINSSPLNKTEFEQLKSAISLFERLGGSPQFKWISELGPKFADKFGLKGNSQPVVGFESMTEYLGEVFISPIFNAIVNKQVLEVFYKPFEKPPFKFVFHPYYLKQYNNRWFVFGRNEEVGMNQFNLSLDRIESLDQVNFPYQENTTDWESYFDGIIGVSRDMERPLEEIELLFSKEQAPYILTKPIHAEMRPRSNEDGSLTVRIKLVINYELVMTILGFGEKVKVISPESLVIQVRNRLRDAVNQY